ncbi:MAG: hypothetical protein ACI4O5_05755, partial [Oscillospiraceae bacterium]
ALRQRKKITVTGSRLEVEYELENVGEKAISMEEYCHNFLSIDGMAISPDYVLETPGLRDYGSEPMKNRAGRELNLIGNGRGFTFAKPDLGVFESNVDLSGMSRETPFVWKLSHKGAKAHIEGEESDLPSRLNIWGTDHLISPEFIHRIDLAPGETTIWKRTMTFVDELM